MNEIKSELPRALEGRALEGRECYSTRLTPNELATYWTTFNPISWKKDSDFMKRYEDIRKIILRFLLMDRHQSEIERLFGGMENDSRGKPSIKYDTLLEHMIMKSFKKNQEMFAGSDQETAIKSFFQDNIIDQISTAENEKDEDAKDYGEDSDEDAEDSDEDFDKVLVITEPPLASSTW